jgi:hypothetical protein
MVPSLKLAVITDGEHLTDVGFTHGKTIHFGSPEFIADYFGKLSLSDEGKVPDVVFMEMTHNGSPSLHTILEESANEGDTTSSGGGSSGFSISRGCNMATPSTLITTTPPSEGTPTPLTIATVPLQAAKPQPDNELSSKQQRANQEEQQAWAHAWQVDAERRTMRWQSELTGEQVTIEAQLA